MNKIQVYIIVGIAVVFGTVVGVNFQISNADIEPATKAEMFNFMNENYVSQKSFDSTMLTLENHDHALVYADHQATVLALQDIREDISELKIEVAKLKIQVNGGTGTSTGGTITISIDASCYERGDVVHFEGMATPSRQLTSSIYEDKAIFEASPTTNTASNGSYNLFWVIPDDISLGTYIAKLEDSGGKYGQTTVNVENNC